MSPASRPQREGLGIKLRQLRIDERDAKQRPEDALVVEITNLDFGPVETDVAVRDAPEG